MRSLEQQFVLGRIVPIVSISKGGPGVVLLTRGPQDQHKVGGFLIQVPSLNEAEALASLTGHVQG
jgi:hypothetical protein